MVDNLASWRLSETFFSARYNLVQRELPLLCLCGVWNMLQYRYEKYNEPLMGISVRHWITVIHPMLKKLQFHMSDCVLNTRVQYENVNKLVFAIVAVFILKKFFN